MSLDMPSIQKIDGSCYRIAVIASRYNEALVDSLVHQACATIEASGAATPVIERVPGAAELPFAAATLAKPQPPAARAPQGLSELPGYNILLLSGSR